MSGMKGGDSLVFTIICKAPRGHVLRTWKNTVLNATNEHLGGDDLCMANMSEVKRFLDEDRRLICEFSCPECGSAVELQLE
jgi:hypothetical protein